MELIAQENRQSGLVESILTTSVRVGPYELPNRIVMAPLTRNRAGTGNVPQAMNVEYYAQRTSAGLIITEAPKSRRRVLVTRTRRASILVSK